MNTLICTTITVLYKISSCKKECFTITIKADNLDGKCSAQVYLADHDVPFQLESSNGWSSKSCCRSLTLSSCFIDWNDGEAVINLYFILDVNCLRAWRLVTKSFYFSNHD